MGLSHRKQNLVAGQFGVVQQINPEYETLRRHTFLADYARATGAAGFVLGISGGVDSAVAGKLAQMAVDRLNRLAGRPLPGQASSEYRFIAMRLPYGEQRDETDAQQVLGWIKPTQIIVYDIKPAVDAAAAEYQRATGQQLSDFAKGNLKARTRMLAQYAVAAENGCLVIGTDHAAEALMGFYTKWGDGAADLCPLSTLDKRQVRQIAGHLGLAQTIIEKRPTADLEDLRPQLADEDALGLTYDAIDDFLEGHTVPADVVEQILRQVERTEHKRRRIPGI